MRKVLSHSAIQVGSRIIPVILSALLFSWNVSAQEKSQKVFTEDIDNFWVAFDSIQATNDSLRQIHFIKTLYIDKGSQGLKAFMLLRSYSAEGWVQLINRSPKFWASVRPNTLATKNKAPMIEASIRRFKELYPQLSDAKMYFTIGGLRSGGTTMGNLILVGSEIATATKNTDVSDLPEGTAKWLGGVFKEQGLDNIVPLNIHEYVHTQQRGDSKNLLGQSIKEGSCDFITELVMGSPMQNNYIQYGRLHDKELAEKFKVEMFTPNFSNWLGNGSRAKTMADLGYYMGYAICKSYYSNSSDKKNAIKEIIELNYSDSAAVENFLIASKYYSEPLNKAELRAQFEAARPRVISIEPIGKEDSTASADVKELKIVFSTAIDGGISIVRGKETYPITEIVGFSEDKTSCTLKVKLESGNKYEFVVTNYGLQSATGYPLKPYRVRFRTP